MEAKMKDLSLLRRLTLKTITKIQRRLLKINHTLAVDLYYKLASLHFKTYFKGISLVEETLNNTEIGYKAAQRHSRLVVSVLYKDSDSVRKKMVKAAARGAFVKNIILETAL